MSEASPIFILLSLKEGQFVRYWHAADELTVRSDRIAELRNQVGTEIISISAC